MEGGASANGLMALAQVLHQAPLSVTLSAVPTVGDDGAARFPSTSLYIEDLDINVTDSQLSEMEGVMLSRPESV